MDKQELKRHGLKVTAPRVMILQLLEAKPGSHLSAEEIFRLLQEQGQDIGLATVYRVLTQFETAGIVIRHNFENAHAVFEINPGEHHDHLVCVKCGKVQEFLDETIEACQTRVAEQAGFQITDHSLYIYGVCPKCQ